MGSIITVRKTQQAEAIQINSPEEERVVRGWLSGMGVEDHAGIEDLKNKKFWFLRDHGSEIVYVVPPGDFLTMYEEVAEAAIQGEPITEVVVEDFLKQFTFNEDS